ncbi:hypothetical protein [Paenibacillus sp. IHBB 3054]|uniref:hypothetical protein n=1 Tax=Paenibacillus sp. IHBB 3054 TaxID=3425689 RepID=UPI003F66770D
MESKKGKKGGIANRKSRKRDGSAKKRGMAFKKMLLQLRVEFQFNALYVLRDAEVNLPDDALEESLLRLRGSRMQQRLELAQ